MAYTQVGMLKKKKMMVKRRRVVRRKTSPKVQKLAPVIRRYVNKALHRQIENKVCPFNTNTSVVDVPFNPLATQLTSSPPSVYRLSNIWTISQGTGQSDRVGNVITPRKWNLSVYLHNNGSTNVPSLVRVIIFKLKDGFGVPFTSQPSDILQTGNLSSGGQGNYLDLNRPINTDKYTLYYSRIFKIGGSVSGTTIGNGNNDFSCVRHVNIDLLKFQRQKIKYTDNTSTPINSGLYMSFFIAPYGGDTLNAPSGIMPIGYPQVSFDLMGEYEDA